MILIMKLCNFVMTSKKPLVKIGKKYYYDELQTDTSYCNFVIF